MTRTADQRSGKESMQPTESPWHFPQADPVIRPGQLQPEFDSGRASAAQVVRLGDCYRMVYWGSNATGHYILQAEAPVDSPNDWKPMGGPLIGPQPDSEYNCNGPSFPFLLPVTDTYWLLYFCGWGRQKDGKLPNTTGVAISENAGRTWRYHDRHPVIPLDRDYDSEATGSVWVLHENGRFRMYYTAIGKYFAKPEGVQTGHGDRIPSIGIGYAESTDGLIWEKPLADLVVKPRGFGVEPYEYISSKPAIVKGSAGYTMWLNTFGTAYRVHRLTSRDGLRWDWAPRVGPDGEMGIGGPGAFDSHQRSYPCMVREGNEFRCWYTGNDFGTTGMGYAVAAAE
jgi:hypothetical protein